MYMITRKNIFNASFLSLKLGSYFLFALSSFSICIFMYNSLSTFTASSRCMTTTRYVCSSLVSLCIYLYPWMTLYDISRRRCWGWGYIQYLHICINILSVSKHQLSVLLFSTRQLWVNLCVCLLSFFFFHLMHTLLPNLHLITLFSKKNTTLLDVFLSGYCFFFSFL